MGAKGMRVLFLANSCVCYGANNSLLDLAMALKRNIEVIVLLPGNGEMAKRLQKNKIEHYIIPYTMNASPLDLRYKRFENLINNVLFLSDAKKIIKKRKVDLIHTNASNVDFGAWLSIICGIPHVWHIRDVLEVTYPLKYDFPCLERLLRKHADCLISISKYVKKNTMPGKRNVILYNGLNLDKYVIDKRDLFCRETINLLHYGQITEEKGVMDSIKAVEEIVRRGHTNVTLNIVGAKSKYCMELMKYVKAQHLNDYITFWGHQGDMKGFLEGADIVLSCALTQAFGRITAEGMLGECLVIGAKAGATPELIKDGITGYLYSAGNAIELAEKILYVYDHKEKSKEMVKRAKKTAIYRFDSKKYANRILDLYESCLSKR